jgi:hypothetical protein
VRLSSRAARTTGVLGGRASDHRWVDLDVLTGERSNQLVAALLARIEEPPASLAPLLAEAAEGNPFFMEELLRMLIDDGASMPTARHWHVDAERLRQTRVPGTLVEVLQARLDALPPAERRAQQQASVVGFTFWDEALYHLERAAGDALTGLEQRGLTVSQAVNTFDGCVEYVFKHHLLQQVTYDSVLRRWRRELHRGVAVWIRQRSGTRSAEFGPLIAGHLELAGDTRRRPCLATRCRRRDAALRLRHRRRPRRTGARPRRWLAAGVAIRADAGGRKRAGTRQRRTRLRDRHAAWLDELDRLADVIDDDARRSQVRRRAFHLLNPASSGRARHGRRGVGAGGHRSALGARARDVLASVLMRMGRHGEALAQARAGLPLARAGGHRETVANLLTDLGQLLAETGEPLAAAAMFGDALALHRQDGNPYGEVTALGNVADVKRQLGDFAGARERCSRRHASPTSSAIGAPRFRS